MILLPGYSYDAARAADRPLFPGVAGPESAVRGPLVNERVERGGHYLIVTGGTGLAEVSCPHCGLWFRTGYIVAGSDGRIADDLADRALAPFADKTCEGVRLHFLAADVMLT